jgi:hypothetical protein
VTETKEEMEKAFRLRERLEREPAPRPSRPTRRIWATLTKAY